MSPRLFGVLAIGALLTGAGCTGVLVGSDANPSRAELFDLVWRDFDRYYSHFELKGVDWDDVYRRRQPAAAQATSDAQLASAIGAMFVELNDLHVDLVGLLRSYSSVDRTNLHTYFDVATVFANYVAGSQFTASRTMRYGRIGADVGYVWIASFGGSGWTDEIDGVLSSFGSPRLVIVDVRNNGGGSSSNAEAVAARFADALHRFAWVRYRNGPRHGDFTDYIELDIGPAGAQRYAGPVVVLTNRRVVSASEHFVLAMRTRTGTTFLGDTTAGGFGNPLLRELPNGWIYRVPQWIEYDSLKVSHEGVGLAPTTVVPHTAADSIAGRDPQLEAALRP